MKTIYVDRYKDQYSKNKINRMYNIYLNILKKLPFKIKWIYPSQQLDFLQHKNNSVISSWGKLNDDPYLKEYNNKKIKLGLDIKQNGTYWPLWGYYTSKGKIKIKEGKHRIASIILTNYIGKWDIKRKFLCIIVNEPTLFNENIKNNFNNKLKSPIKIQIPFPNNNSFLENQFFNLYNNIKRHYFLKPTINTIQITTKWQLIRITQIWSIFLRDLFYKYKEKYGEIIKPSPIINNQKEWNDFIKK
jgi:hypothetical protein